MLGPTALVSRAMASPQTKCKGKGEESNCKAKCKDLGDSNGFSFWIQMKKGVSSWGGRRARE